MPTPYDKNTKYENFKKNAIPSGADLTACVVYFHSHTGCQIEGKALIAPVLEAGMSICLFDFGGSGHSTGKYVSLGWHEMDQAKSVIFSLKKKFKFKKIGVWGKSMGAATGIFLSTKTIHIDAMVLDSPFSKLNDVVCNIVEHHSHIPRFILKALMTIMRGTIKEKAGFDINEVNPIEYIDKIKIPCVFVTGDSDYIVKFEQF